MFNIDPKTHAIGGAGLLRMGAVVACVVAAGFAARGWIDSLDAGETDDDFACVEDERGTCPSGWRDPIPVSLQIADDPFDDQEANAPTDEDLMAEDESAEEILDAVQLPPPPPSLHEEGLGTSVRRSCIVVEHGSA